MLDVRLMLSLSGAGDVCGDLSNIEHSGDAIEQMVLTIPQTHGNLFGEMEQVLQCLQFFCVVLSQIRVFLS